MGSMPFVDTTSDLPCAYCHEQIKADAIIMLGKVYHPECAPNALPDGWGGGFKDPVVEAEKKARSQVIDDCIKVVREYEAKNSARYMNVGAACRDLISRLESLKLMPSPQETE